MDEKNLINITEENLKMLLIKRKKHAKIVVLVYLNILSTSTKR